MYKIVFYVPTSDAEKVKQALFDAGAGKVGDYECCAWQVLGEGQYKPLAGSNPHIGTQNQLEKTKEYKIEMVCETQHIKKAIQALKDAHPYEEPAYQVLKIENL